MRIVSYNILDGGEGRADPLAEVILSQKPDIVALVEATDLAVIERIAARLKMDYVQGLGASQGSALLSRWTIRDSVNHAAIRQGLSKSFLEATVIDPAGKNRIVGAVHLHAHAKEADETIRERELDVVLEVLARHRASGTPHLLAGDFNANSPVQQIEIERCKKSTQKEYAENGGHLPRRAIQKMLDAGYVDTLGACHPSAGRMGTFSTQHPGQRVDYIFAWGFERSQIGEAWIEHDRLAKYASDHFPIGALIQ
jgi:endonuclease/exonuclease/phosphatase family metal-dependent hydrolase